MGTPMGESEVSTWAPGVNSCRSKKRGGQCPWYATTGQSLLVVKGEGKRGKVKRKNAYGTQGIFKNTHLFEGTSP